MNWFARNCQEEPAPVVSCETPTPVVLEAQEIQQPRELALLGEACRAISEAQTIDEIKSIRDKAEAARKYAESASLGLEIQNHAAEVKLRAERRAGELLAQLKLAGGDRRSKQSDQRLTLEDLGMAKDQSSRWQLVARGPPKVFERYVAETKEQSRELTSTGISKLARRHAPKRARNGAAQAAPEDADGDRCFTTLADLVRDSEPFACVYADPVWTPSEQPMSLEEMCDLPVAELAAENAHLHLWATNEFLFDAFRLMLAWGFEWRSCLVWIRPLSAGGNYWSNAHEFLILGVRGSLPFADQTVKSWLRAEPSDDGRKPDAVRSLIERVSPGPYLELFAEKPVAGWTGYRGPAIEQAPLHTTQPSDEPHQ